MPENESRGSVIARGSTEVRSATAATIRLIGVAAAGAAVLVALALLATGLPSSGGGRPHRLSHTANAARVAPAPKKNAAAASRPGHRAAHNIPLNTSPHPSMTVPARSTLTAVNSIVDETGAGRESVISAIDAVQGCSMTPSEGEAAIGQVLSVREQGLSDLQRLAHVAAATPADRSLIQTLSAVINDSLQADRAYMAWMADVAGGQTDCRGNPMGDANFAAGQTFSAKADSDKQVFVQVWNPLADQDGLSTYQPQDF